MQVRVELLSSFRLLHNFIQHLISGLTLGYLMLLIGKKDKYVHRKFNAFKYVAHHYVKFACITLFAIIIIYLSPLVADGPVSDYVENVFVSQCKTKPFLNILFFNNFRDDVTKVVCKDCHNSNKSLLIISFSYKCSVTLQVFCCPFSFKCTFSRQYSHFCYDGRH